MAEVSDNSPQPSSTGLIILGMHRSGTSALAGALGLCGAWLGESGELTVPNFENPRGFWERRDIRGICDRLLRSAGADWWKVAAFEPGAVPHAAIADEGRAFQRVVAELENHRVWAIKEPRLCLLFQILRSYVPNCACIHVFRNPLEVALSLRARNGFGVAEGLALWENYNREALRASYGLPRLLVSYEMLVSDPERTLSALLRELSSLGITDLVLPSSQTLEAFITPGLRRQTAKTADTTDFLLPSQRELWSLLESGAALDMHSPDGLSNVAHQYLRDLESQKGSVDKLTAAAKKLSSEIQKQKAHTGSLKAELDKQRAKAKELSWRLRAQQARSRALESDKEKLAAKFQASDARVAAIYASHSWRFTVPLRAVSRLVKRVLRLSRNVLRLLWWLLSGQSSRAAKVLLPRFRRYVPSRVKAIPRTVKEAARSRLKAEEPQLRSQVARSRFGQELQRITAQETSRAFADALRGSESQLAQMIARLQSLADRPLVSIVMPTYNRAEIVGGAITTVLEQQYYNWELLVCDDGSSDDTEAVVARFLDGRIRYLNLPKQGAAAARNAGLREAQGSIIAYLDSDNFWHPAFLSGIVLTLIENPGSYSVYTDFIDFQVDEHGRTTIKSFRCLPFQHERLLNRPYIDLNSFAHRRELYECFGGFDERLKRRQDYDLIIKYTWLRDPLHLSCLATLYQRNEKLTQITRMQREDRSCISIIDHSVKGYFRSGLPALGPRSLEKVTILFSGKRGDHLLKTFGLAEALSTRYNVQLISFRSFDEDTSPLLQGVSPSFDVVDLPGSRFPDFFESMRRALAAIRGDVIYVVEPHLTSLGLALLDNCQRGTPIILEVDDPETIVSSPKSRSDDTETGLDARDLDSEELLNPCGEFWSQLMHTLARKMPVVATNCDAIREHGHDCLYMPNVTDEQVYDPAAYDRDVVRTELGFRPEDRVILFGDLIPEHENIRKIFELAEHLAIPHYKLLFIGAYPTADPKRLAEHYGERVRILPPQTRQAIARITYAADLILLWADQPVTGSRYQMPYEAIEALAMGRPIIASDSPGFGLLAKQGYLRVAPCGDWAALTRLVQEAFENRDEAARKGTLGRRLFLRQFSYAVARGNFALAAHRALANGSRTLPAAVDFGRRFNQFFRQAARANRDFIPFEEGASLRKSNAAREIMGYGESEKDGAIVVVDAEHLGMLSHQDLTGAAVLMPVSDADRALKTARILIERAGMDVTVFLVTHTPGQGFVRIINDAAHHLKVAYIVYVTEDVFPGVHWLKVAYEALERTGKGLLAFNDGKSRGRVAAFGMVRMRWAKSIYGGPIFFPGYRAHGADRELTLIARVMNEFIYEPTATLVEVDLTDALERGEGLDQRKQMPDHNLFCGRFHSTFDSRFRWREVAQYKDEYLNIETPRVGGGEAVEPAKDAIQHVEVGNIRHISWQDQDGIAVIMPCINPAAGDATAKLLVQRAGIAAKVYVVEDTLRKGFISTLNEMAAQLSVKYIVYLAEDAFPGVNWLRTAHTKLEETGKGLLAFNCGKWHGRVAAFGMVRKDWVQQVYGPGLVLHPAYKAHKADNELTVIARVLQQFVYEPDSVLIENDPEKVFKEDVPEDKTTFHFRFRAGFDGLLTLEQVKPLADSYFVPLNSESRRDPPKSESVGDGKTDSVNRSSRAATSLPTLHSASKANGLVVSESAGSSSRTMTSLRPQILEQEKRKTSDPALSNILGTLRTLAGQALERRPYSVADKTTLPPSGDCRDYWHPAPYWWPDPKKPDGLPYVRKDGERVPGTRLYEPDSEKYDRTRLQRVFDDSLTLGLAWSFFEEKRYAEAGARILERFFVDPNTSMRPHLKYAQVRMGHNSNKGVPAGLIEAKDMYFYLDAVRLFQDAGVLSDPVFQRFCNWLAKYLEWLLTSDQGKAERAASNNHGTCYDLQIAAIASFLGDKGVVYETLARAQNRVSEQFTPEGHQPEEIKRKATAHYCCFNLQSWINLAELSSRWGVDLWEYETPTGAGLKNAAQWLISMKDKPWPYEQIDEFDSERFLPIWFAASEHLDSIEHADKPGPCVYAVKSVFFPHDGIRPFWNLASYAATADSRKQLAAKGREASWAGQ